MGFEIITNNPDHIGTFQIQLNVEVDADPTASQVGTKFIIYTVNFERC